MIYAEGKIENGKIVLTNQKTINQNKLTSECWLIQFNGLDACKKCEFLNTKECGGKRIRKNLLKQKRDNRKLFNAIYGKKGERQ